MVKLSHAPSSLGRVTLRGPFLFQREEQGGGRWTKRPLALVNEFGMLDYAGLPGPPLN